MTILRKFQTAFYSAVVIIPALLSGCEKKETKAPEWVPIFNGSDLTGWDIKIAGQPLNDNYLNTFRVENGMLRVAYDQYKTFDGKFGHIYYQVPYSYYKIKLQYRFVGPQAAGAPDWGLRNSGIMIHSQAANTLELKQDFPVSLEVQLLGGIGEGERHTANVCTPGTLVHIGDSLRAEHCISSNSKTFEGDQWVEVMVEVYGDSLIRNVVNGDTVLTFTKPVIGGGFVSETHDWKAAHIENFKFWTDLDGSPLTKGTIALQAESQPIDFANIEILNLVGCRDPKAKNYRDYFVKADNSTCKY